MSDATPRPSDDAAKLIIDAWRAGRPIVPFLGAGISLSAGFPTIRQLTEYLAKVVFAIEVGIYESRYPMVVDGIDTAHDKYSRRPAEFIADFGWPDIRQLNADVWRWINLVNRSHGSLKSFYLKRLRKLGLSRVSFPREAVQAVLKQRLTRGEGGLAHNHLKTVTLNGDWSDLLIHLTEGHLDLVDALFTGLDRGRHPTSAHVSLAFLAQLMGIRLILSVNFDTLLEQAMAREDIPVRTFDIHRDADLPHPAIVAQQHSLIKLHGSAYGLRFGERLNYSLEEEAEQRLHEYLPTDALMVVIGFSGWERRMMQIIEGFARRSAGTARTQVLWLDVIPPDSPSTSENLSRMQKELERAGLLHALRREQFCDANSFLSGLLATLSNGFPSSSSRYSVLPSRPRLPPSQIRLGLPHDIDSGVIVLSEVSINKALPRKAEPSSWATFVAAEYAASKQTQRDIIWVDLENHHTVEGVVKDVFRQIRSVDPSVPQLFLPAEDLGQDDSSLRRATSRLRAALLRSNYLVVFDSMESFSRPQLVHHGMPKHFTKQQQETIRNRLHRLGTFLEFLTRHRDTTGYITPDLQNTVVVLTSTILTNRHSTPDVFVNELNAKTREIARRICAGAAAAHKFDLSRNKHNRSYIDGRMHKHLAARDILRKTLPRTGVTGEEWGRWAHNAVGFRRKLSARGVSLELDDTTKALFVAFLSVLRRPRPRALVGCLLSRWLFDSGASSLPFQLAEINNVVDRLLCDLHSEGYIEYLEGEIIWIPRATNEEVYQRISAPLQLSILEKPTAWPAAIISGFLVSTWHLQAARVAFADVYIPTHDEHAFFEYVYHRVAGLRYLAILQSLLHGMPTSGFSRINAMLMSRVAHPRAMGDFSAKAAFSDGDNVTTLNALIPDSLSNVRDFLDGIGAFSFVRRDPGLRHRLACISRGANKRMMAKHAIESALWYSRIHGIYTLENALSREKDRIGATTTPDTWLGWIEQLLGSELSYVFGHWKAANEARGISRAATLPQPTAPQKRNYDDLCGKLSRTLQELRVTLLRRKFDYQSATNELAKELWPREAQSHDFVSSMVTWVLRGDPATNSEVAWSNLVPRDTAGKSCKYLAVAKLQAEFLRAVSVAGGSRHLRQLTDRLFRSVSEQIKADPTMLKWTELRLLNFRCEQTMNQIPMWDQTPRALEVRQPGTRSDLRNDLVDAERITHQLEDLYRQVVGSTEEYAVLRSRAYTWRARSFYLRGQFREAHRTLNLALSDLGEQAVTHRFARAVVDMCRAELLWISSREHLLLAPGREHLLLAAGALAGSIRKIETGISCLDTAAVWLEPGVHRPKWWIRLHLGRALLRHDQLMLEIMRSVSNDPPHNESYARRSAWLEACAIDGLRSLRVAFDTLPFDDRTWKAVAEGEQTVGPDDTDSDERFGNANIEIALIQTWLKLFVAAFGAHHILLGKLQLPSLAVFSVPSSGWDRYHKSVRAQVENLEKDRIGPLAELLEVYGFWKKKWAPWCEMLQFHRFVRDSGDLFSSRESEGALIIVPEPYLSQHDGTESAVRGYNILMDVLQRGRTLSGKDSIIAKMWDSRRKGLFHRVH